jgi:hypothetical protein
MGSAWWFATHTAPSATAIPNGAAPFVGIRAMRAFVFGSIRSTVLLLKLVAQTEPSAKAMSPPPPVRIFATTRIRSSPRSVSERAQTAPAP